MTFRIRRNILWCNFFVPQAVTSFVRAIQLGGKGYAPAESDPLRKHVKGLCDFVQFLDNLEEILGEVPDPRYTTQPNPDFHSLLVFYCRRKRLHGIPAPL